MALVLGVVSLVLSYAGVGRLRRWAEHARVLDIPNERSSHTLPTPRGGGLVIVILSTVGLLLVWLRTPALPPLAVGAYLAGAWLIAGVSWLDDLRSLPKRIRFASHCLGAILVIVGFGFWRAVSASLGGSLLLGWVGMAVTFAWIVGLTNAYNFMDGIDGLAGGQAVVAGLGWATLGWLAGQPLVSALGLLLAGTSLGFLGHNWPPAKVFLGDVGSAFLGFSFAVLPVMVAQGSPRLALAGPLLFWPFVFDASFTFLRRLRNGENVFSSHRSHLYQRLVIAGRSHRLVSTLYIGLALTGLGLALAWYLGAVGKVALLVVPLLCAGLWGFVRREERRRISAPGTLSALPETPPQR